MTPCQECNSARECGGHNWRRFDALKCLFCAARLIQAVGKLAIGNTEASKRRSAALELSVAAGLDEKAIRKLVKGAIALEPLPEKTKK